MAVQVGHDDASLWYTNMQKKQADAIGITYELCELPAEATQNDLAAALAKLNAYANVSGVILQMPLPNVAMHISNEAQLLQKHGNGLGMNLPL